MTTWPWMVAALLILGAVGAYFSLPMAPDTQPTNGVETTNSGVNKGGPALAPASPQAGDICRFTMGQRLALRFESNVKADVNRKNLFRGLGGPGMRVTMTGALDVKMTMRWRIEARVIALRESGATVLATRLHDLTLEPKSPDMSSTGDTTPLFLIELDERCGINRYGWRDDVDLLGARTQQSLMATFHWRYAPAGHRGRFELRGRDAKGDYTSWATVAESGAERTIVSRKRGYKRLFNKARSTANKMEVVVSGTGLKVHVGTRPWFESASFQEKTTTKEGGRMLTMVTTTASARAIKPGTETLAADPDAPGWQWGDLLATKIKRAKLKQLKDLAGFKGMRTEDAVAELLRMIRDPNSKLFDRAEFLESWIKANPAKIGELLAWMKKNSFNDKTHMIARSDILVALRGAETAEARQAMLDIISDPSWSSGTRVHAALVMTDNPNLSPQYVEALLALSRKGAEADGDTYASRGATAMLGATYRDQKDQNPKLAKQLLEEVSARLDNTTDADLYKDAVTAAGNSGEKTLLAKLQPAMNHERADIREEAADALRLMPSAETAELFGPWLEKEKSGEVRTTLAKSYWKQAFLTNTSPHPAVVKAAIKGLAVETESVAAGKLVQLLGEAIERDKNAAAIAALKARFKGELQRGARKNYQLMKTIGSYVGAGELFK